MIQDQAERDAAALLTCEFEGTEAGCCVRDMGEKCASCERRPAVAAALRQQAEAHKAEVDKLKAELHKAERIGDDLREQMANWHTRALENHARLEAAERERDSEKQRANERDAAYIAGLEAAKERAERLYDGWEIAAAIQALIDQKT